MKKILFICAVLLQVLYLSAQNNSKVEDEIRALEEKEYNAMVNQDSETLQRIWATDFMVNAPFNRVTLSSHEVLELVKKGVIKYSSFKRNIEEIMIQKNMVITMGSEEVVPLGDVPNARETVKRRYTIFG